MQEDNSLAEKILSDIEYIINSDDQLKGFSIVPVPENEKNKSPVLYEEHNLGLEMWCVKHVYKYLHAYLLKVRAQLQKNRVSQTQLAKLNKLLMGAVLIQADVPMFWNMRRELIENEVITTDKELLLTKLVLSHKSKSNEAFSHRRWIMKRLLRHVPNNNSESLARTFLENEFQVTEMASQNSQNNYHAWTHRLWSIRNIAPSLLPTIIVRELDFSFDWILFNVSEHAGFHYRQQLFTFLKGCHVSDIYFNVQKNFVMEYFHISNSHRFSILDNLFGQNCAAEKSRVNQNYFYVALFELLHTLEKLNKSFPAHESIWYHRRYVLYSLLQSAYEFFGIQWQRNVKLDDSKITKDVNIVNGNISDTLIDDKFQENGEKCPKLFKAEPTLVEGSPLYKLLVKIEVAFLSANSTSNNSLLQIEFCKRHEKWLKLILAININD